MRNTARFSNYCPSYFINRSYHRRVCAMAAEEGAYEANLADGVATILDRAGGLRATVSARGAELSSLAVRRGASGEFLELLYQGGPEWQGKAPHLWPAVGRSYTASQLDTEGDIAHCAYQRGDGPVREVPIHGFLLGDAAVDWETRVSAGDDGAEVVCTLDSSALPAALLSASYPHSFALEARFVVAGGRLSFTMRVTNTAEGGDGEAPLPFSIGNHITVNFPFTGDGAWEKGLIRGTPTEELKLTGRSLLSGESEARPELAEGLSLASKAPDACNMVLGGAGSSDECYLEVVQPGAFAVRVTQTFPRDSTPAELTSSLRDNRFFVLWGSEEGGFFCPEPWLGGPNSLNTGDGLVQLNGGSSFDWGFDVDVRDA